jgi:hypothetical protein
MFAPIGQDMPYWVFISADPIGLEGGINLYAYVGNNPVNWIDPWGLVVIVPNTPHDGCPPGVNCIDPGTGIPPESGPIDIPGQPKIPGTFPKIPGGWQGRKPFEPRPTAPQTPTVVPPAGPAGGGGGRHVRTCDP